MKERYRNVTVTLQKIKKLELGCWNKYKAVSELVQNNFGIIFSTKTTLLNNVSIIVQSVPEGNSVNQVIDDVIDNGIDEEFLESIQDPGLHYSNPPHHPVSIPKKCLALSPPQTKVKAKVPQESQRVSSGAKKGRNKVCK